MTIIHQSLWYFFVQSICCRWVTSNQSLHFFVCFPGSTIPPAQSVRSPSISPCYHSPGPNTSPAYHFTSKICPGLGPHPNPLPTWTFLQKTSCLHSDELCCYEKLIHNCNLDSIPIMLYLFSMIDEENNHYKYLKASLVTSVYGRDSELDTRCLVHFLSRFRSINKQDFPLTKPQPNTRTGLAPMSLRTDRIKIVPSKLSRQA